MYYEVGPWPGKFYFNVNILFNCATVWKKKSDLTDL